MKKVNHEGQTIDLLNAEYVVLQTGSMNFSNKSMLSKFDNLSLLLQESDSVTNFRFYLDSINSGHFLDFWFACQGFKNFDRSDTHKLHQLTKVIYREYVRSESPYAVPLKQSTKKEIVDKLSIKKYIDQSIFDTAQMEIREILSGEFLVNFLQSDFYTESKQIERNSLTVFSSSNNNSKIHDPISEIPVSICTSSDNADYNKISASKFNMTTSRSFEMAAEGNCNKLQSDNFIGPTQTDENNGTITSLFNNNNNNTNQLNNNGNGTGFKDRRNLSEVDPPAFAKLLCSKLEEILNEQAKFEKLLRLVKSSVPAESDTDDSGSSAISYLMRCHWGSSHDGHSNRSIETDFLDAVHSLAMKTNSKLKSNYKPCDIRDDHAQDILENHCSRIGLDKPSTRYFKKELFEGGKTGRREHDLGSITSYDSGVATSLEQYSSFGKSGSILENLLWQKNNLTPTNVNEIGFTNTPNHRYHHHHHHHHKGHYSINKSQISTESIDNSGSAFYRDAPTKRNNISDVSSNFDSGVSSAYEYMGRRFHSMNEKVTNWMCKNPNIVPKSPFNVHDFDSNTTSGIPPNTPLTSVRGYTSPCFCDIYPNQIYMCPKSLKQPSLFSAVPECESVSHQNLENWLEQQATISASSIAEKSIQKVTNTNVHKSCYCSSTVEQASSELTTNYESLDTRDKESTFNEARISNVIGKEQSVSKTNTNSSKSNSLVVGYYMGNDPVPYRSQIPDAQFITLGQFKSLVAKKGPFRYFFKRYCDGFDCGVVHEEITRDDAILPLWEGKVVAKIERAE